MRRTMNGTRSSNANSSSRQSTMTRRSTFTEEQNGNKGGKPATPPEDENTSNAASQDGVNGAAGPVTARLKMLEKRYAQLLEMQAKFNILDKWLQVQFGVKLFPSEKVNMEKFEASTAPAPEDADNPFYAVYLAVQRTKLLEERVKRLEARPFEEMGELKPISNYSAAHAFRNLRGGRGGGVKRTYGSGSNSSTPKKAKLMPRPVQQPSGYPFKPSVKIIQQKDSNAQYVQIKREQEPVVEPNTSSSLFGGGASASGSPVKSSESVSEQPVIVKEEASSVDGTKEGEAEAGAVTDEGTTSPVASTETPKEKDESSSEQTEKMDVDPESGEKPSEDTETQKMVEGDITEEDKTEEESVNPSAHEGLSEEAIPGENVQEEGGEPGLLENLKNLVEPLSPPEEIPVLEDATAIAEDSMALASEEEEGDEEDELDVKPDIDTEQEVTEEAIETPAKQTGRLSTRRAAAAAAQIAAAQIKTEEDEKSEQVMYTTRGRRHTVPRRYAEFTGHDNVVSILKSQQRAEKSAASGSGRPGRKSTSAAAKQQQDTPPKIRKMVKGAKTPSPRKAASAAAAAELVEEDEDLGSTPGPSTKKKYVGRQRPACVDALVDRIMAREVDADGHVMLSETNANVYVNQQALLSVVIRSNGKSTRLTRKMTTLVFEDSTLASASPFGTKYYKDRLPPEPLEAMVDFIADSGFDPQYSKKKIYMIVGQVCNEARAGRVSKKYMQPMEATPGPSGSQQSGQSEDGEGVDTDVTSTASETAQSSQNLS